MKLTRSNCLLAVSFAFLSSFARAQDVWPWSESADLDDPAAGASDRFGTSVAMSGDRALVGAPFDDQGGVDAGAVYAYVRSGATWTLQAKILAANPQPNGQFGTSIAIDGDTAIVGAPSSDVNGVGSAHVLEFKLGAWSETAELDPSGSALHQKFGAAVTIHRDTLAIGATGIGTLTSGSVSIFRRNPSGWVLLQSIANLGINAYFSIAVGLRDQTLLIGAPLKVLVYHEASPQNWVPVTSLTGQFTASQFGFSISMSDKSVAIGAPNPIHNIGASSVEVYSYDPVTSQNFLRVANLYTHASLLFRNRFGTSVSLVESQSSPGELLAVGAPRDNFIGKNQGTVTIYSHIGGEWKFLDQIEAPNGATDDQLGTSVALSGTTLFTGAWQADGAQADSGAAYAYELVPVATSYCTAKTNSLGCTPTISSTGIPSASASSGFTVDCSGALPKHFGILMYSSTPNQHTYQGGWMCVTGPAQRSPGMKSSDAKFCESSYQTDFNAWIASGVDPSLVPGTGVFCQWFMRDPANSFASASSNALWFQVGP